MEKEWEQIVYHYISNSLAIEITVNGLTAAIYFFLFDANDNEKCLYS